jgi:Type II secretion system (T2SS), protein L
VESQNRLGIYIGRDTATAVYFGAQAKEGGVPSRFGVSAEGQEQPGFLTLAGLIAQGCAERQWKFTDVAVALDCAMFMQHSVHNGFNDPKQIAATVKFDTEEVLATDISTVALAFEVVSSDSAGSELAVFTAERRILSEVLSALQQYGFDPVTIEPDVCCLSRFISRKAASVEPLQAGTLFAILGRHSGYLIGPPAPDPEGNRTGATLRTFLVGRTQNRAQLLARESLIAIATAEEAEPVTKLRLFDSTGTVDCQQLGEKLSVEAGEIDLVPADGSDLHTPADDVDPADFAMAYGAALTPAGKGHKVDFRSDFSPFQGKKLKRQRALKAAAVSVTILLIAVGLYFQTQLFSVNRDRNNLRNKFAKNYADVTLKKLPNNVATRKAVSDLERLLRRIEAEKKGLITDKTSVRSKLTLVLTAFNKCAAQTNLNISSITITSKDILITGDTSSRQTRQKLFDTLRNNGLEILRQHYVNVGGRESFSIAVTPKAAGEEQS